MEDHMIEEVAKIADGNIVHSDLGCCCWSVGYITDPERTRRKSYWRHSNIPVAELVSCRHCRMTEADNFGPAESTNIAGVILRRTSRHLLILNSILLTV